MACSSFVAHAFKARVCRECGRAQADHAGQTAAAAPAQATPSTTRAAPSATPATTNNRFGAPLKSTATASATPAAAKPVATPSAAAAPSSSSSSSSSACNFEVHAFKPGKCKHCGKAEFDHAGRASAAATATVPAATKPVTPATASSAATPVAERNVSATNNIFKRFEQTGSNNTTSVSVNKPNAVQPSTPTPATPTPVTPAAVTPAPASASTPLAKPVESCVFSQHAFKPDQCKACGKKKVDHVDVSSTPTPAATPAVTAPAAAVAAAAATPVTPKVEAPKVESLTPKVVEAKFEAPKAQPKVDPTVATATAPTVVAAPSIPSPAVAAVSSTPKNTCGKFVAHAFRKGLCRDCGKAESTHSDANGTNAAPAPTPALAAAAPVARTTPAFKAPASAPIAAAPLAATPTVATTTPSSTTSTATSASCSSFKEHAWKAAVCANCNGKKVDHAPSSLPVATPSTTSSKPSIASGLTVGLPSKTVAPVVSVTASPSTGSPARRTSFSSSVTPKKQVSCDNFVPGLLVKSVCSTCTHPEHEHSSEVIRKSRESTPNSSRKNSIVQTPTYGVTIPGQTNAHARNTSFSNAALLTPKEGTPRGTPRSSISGPAGHKSPSVAPLHKESVAYAPTPSPSVADSLSATGDASVSELKAETMPDDWDPLNDPANAPAIQQTTGRVSSALSDRIKRMSLSGVQINPSANLPGARPLRGSVSGGASSGADFYGSDAARTNMFGEKLKSPSPSSDGGSPDTEVASVDPVAARGPSTSFSRPSVGGRRAGRPSFTAPKFQQSTNNNATTNQEEVAPVTVTITNADNTSQAEPVSSTESAVETIDEGIAGKIEEESPLDLSTNADVAADADAAVTADADVATPVDDVAIVDAAADSIVASIPAEVAVVEPVAAASVAPVAAPAPTTFFKPTSIAEPTPAAPITPAAPPTESDSRASPPPSPKAIVTKLPSATLLAQPEVKAAPMFFKPPASVASPTTTAAAPAPAPKPASNRTAASLFGEDDDDIFGEKSMPPAAAPAPAKATLPVATKSSLFGDDEPPAGKSSLKALADDDDDDFFLAASKKQTATAPTTTTTTTAIKKSNLFEDDEDDLWN